MADVALTPRVWLLLVCDEVIPSDLEDDVFTLFGARQRRLGEAAFSDPLYVYLVLSCIRAGDYPGRLILVDEIDEAIRLSRDFTASFENNNELRPIYLDLGEWPDLELGRYWFQVWFSDPGGDSALKAEYPFMIHSTEG